MNSSIISARKWLMIGYEDEPLGVDEVNGEMLVPISVGLNRASHAKSGALAPINPARFRDRRPCLDPSAAQIPIRSTSSRETVWRRRS